MTIMKIANRVCLLVVVSTLLMGLPHDLAAQGDVVPGRSDSLDRSDAWSYYLKALRVTNIGSTNRGTGRISAFAVYENNPRIIYVGSASGGVFKTENGGVTFNAVFDREGSSSIGAVAVSQQNPDLVWVGTGESWLRNSVLWGDGIYKSADGGKTWQQAGLKNSYCFSRIVIHPRNNNIVYAAVMGSAWGENEERGVYKTTDGGKTWKRILFINPLTACSDLVMDPHNPDNLIAGMWEYYRKPYMFHSGGAGSGIFRTTDGGKNWQKVTKGLPNTTLGRIGLDYFRKDPRIVIAGVEYRDPMDTLIAKTEELGKKARPGGTKIFRSEDGGLTWRKLALFGTTSWKPENKIPIGEFVRPFYMGPPRQDPVDPNRIYVTTYNGSWITDDAGKTWTGQVVSGGGDPHALWINPKDNRHMLDANDHYMYVSTNRGVSTVKLNLPPVNQLYGVGFDMRKPYWIYAGGQDGAATWGAPSRQQGARFISQDDFIGGGADTGVPIADPKDHNTVYYTDSHGGILRFNLATGTEKVIAGKHHPEGAFEKTSWWPPIIISAFDHKTVYAGSNKLVKSTNRGDDWQVLSGDLSKNYEEWQRLNQLSGGITPERTGAENTGTITTISESPFQPGLLWVGTDDGNVQLTLNDGASWQELSKNFPGLPKDTWCTGIVASPHSKGRAYATFDGHRLNDFSTYVYVTEDLGKTWRSINGNLPAKEPCFVIREGLVNPDLLFLGTWSSLYVSIDRGATWISLPDKSAVAYHYMPRVNVHDMHIHPRELDLVVGTHGRGVYIIPIRALEELGIAMNAPTDIHFISPTVQYIDTTVVNFPMPSDVELDFYVYSKKAQEGPVELHLVHPGVEGMDSVATIVEKLEPGINRVTFYINPKRIGRPGKYRVMLRVGGREFTRMFETEYKQ